jgi:pSer/pThr/pTyr-binding forkhead associated (FHA) protein
MDKDRFDAVKEAFEALRTPDNRAAYDAQLKAMNEKSVLKTGTLAIAQQSIDYIPVSTNMLQECPVCGHNGAPGETYCSECGFLLTASGDEFNAQLEELDALRRQPQLADDSGNIYPLHPGINTVGREKADISINDKTVSRLHAQLVYDEDRGIISVEDEESTNGTAVNGQRLVPHAPHPLLPGDIVSFGSAPLRLIAYQQAEMTPTSEVTAITGAPGDQDVVGSLRIVHGSGPQFGRIYKGQTTIGRLPDNHICILNDRYISGHHATIEVEDDIIHLTDLGSTNGTLLNGLRLTPNESVAINDGDEVTVGGSVYVYSRKK